jgi:hypothetical protein
VSWWQLGPSLAAAVLLLFGPGLLIGASIGLRRLSLLASAPALGTTLMALWGLAAGAFGFSYSPVGLLLATVVVSVLALAVRGGVRLMHRPRARSDARGAIGAILARDLRTVWPALAGTAAAAALIGWRLKVAFDRPENISQTYDNIFHLNAVQYGLETGDASSLSITRFLSDVDAPSFYPAAWHDAVISVGQLAGGSVPFSVNATNLVLAAIVWPLGSIFLARQLFGAKARVALWTGILSAAFPAFPLLMLDFGVLYPYMLSLALLPVAIGLLVGAFRMARDGDQGPASAWAALLLMLPGLGLAHPSTVLSFLLLATPLLVSVVVLRFRRLSGNGGGLLGYLWPVVVFLLFLEALRRLWIGVRPLPEASRWEARATQAQAIGEALAAAPLERPVAWVVFALTVSGFFVLLRRGPAWVAASFALATALYVVANGTVFGEFRSFVTGVWYNDPFRLAALLPVLAVPLTVASMLAVHAWLERCTDRLRTTPPTRRRSALAAAGVVALLLAWSSQGEAMDVATVSANGQYRLTNDAALLSADERQLLDTVEDIVPEGETVVGSPWTGASLVYPLADRESVTPYVFGGRNDNVTLILERLSDVTRDPAVCEAVENEESYWVLDFGLREVHDGAHASPGMLDLARNAGLELVSSVGEARLYEITACDR